MRVTVEVPDRLGPRANKEHRTLRQQVEYMVQRALRELEDREQLEAGMLPEPKGLEPSARRHVEPAVR